MCQGYACVSFTQQSGGVIRMKSILGILLLLANAGSVLASDLQTGYAAQPAARDDLVLAAARPAAGGESPEQLELNKLPLPARQVDINLPTRGWLIEKCLQTTGCARQLPSAQHGGKQRRPRPAASGESPEEAEFRKLRPPRKPDRPPRSEVVPTLLNKLLALINPIATAHAAGGLYSVYLTPGSNTLPSARIYGFGVVDYDYTRKQDAYLLHHYGSTTRKYAEGKPYVMLTVNVPKTGDYLINFKGSRGRAKLRHQPSGPVVNEWDLRSTACDPCDYVASLELDAGYHYFYYWTDDAYQWVYSASVMDYDPLSIKR